jgi:hypothetical protein
MRTKNRTLRLAFLLSLLSIGFGSIGCWGWHHPMDDRHDDGRYHHEDHRDDDHR